jgi:hypothetical protein
MVVERPVVSAIVHPDAIRIAAEPSSAPRSSTAPIAPHAIVFASVRPPPGKSVAPAPAPRVAVRAVAHPDANRPATPRPAVERSVSQPKSPHRITFAPAIAPPRRS